jgi:rhamnosyltransferase subunit B
MRIVFASLGSLGDLHPLLALAEEARSRGHKVSVAASAGYRELVGSLGYEFHRLRPDLNHDTGRREYLSHPAKGPERFMTEELFPSARETYADLLAAAGGADALVVGELLYVAPLVAAKLRIPWANVILSPSSFLSACDPCVLAPAPWLHGLRHLGRWPHRLIFAIGRAVTANWGKPLLVLREELGFPPGPSPVFEGKHSRELVLACFPRFFAAPQTDWPSAVVQTGFPFFAQSCPPEVAARIDRFVAAGTPPIVFTLGSTAVHIARDFYATAAAAARALGRRAILLMGANAQPTAADDLLSLAYAPLEAVIPHAAAVVHHGGVGTSGETLRAGVPSLVIPFGYDQPDNGERLRKLGVGRVLPRHRVSQATLTEGLRAILENPAMITRARELSRQIHPAAELSASLDAIERLVRPVGVEALACSR